MKKLAVLTTALALLVATSAQAKDLGGKFGLGYEATLGGVQGLSLSYFVTHALAIDVLLGLQFVSPDSGDSLFGFNAAIGARYNFARAKDTNLGIGLRVDLGFANKAAMGGADSSFQANIELPLVVEHFFGEHFAITLATGLTVEIVPEKGQVLTPMGTKLTTPAKGFGLAFFNGGLMGHAGFKFYF
jgi:hypothetical protein